MSRCEGCMWAITDNTGVVACMNSGECPTEEERNTMEKEYTVPTQVAFRDYDDYVIHGGIAFGYYIICGCCGSIYEIDDVEIIKDLEWVSLKDEILGDVIDDSTRID